MKIQATIRMGMKIHFLIPASIKLFQINHLGARRISNAKIKRLSDNKLLLRYYYYGLTAQVVFFFTLAFYSLYNR